MEEWKSVAKNDKVALKIAGYLRFKHNIDVLRIHPILYFLLCITSHLCNPFFTQNFHHQERGPVCPLIEKYYNNQVDNLPNDTTQVDSLLDSLITPLLQYSSKKLENFSHFSLPYKNTIRNHIITPKDITTLFPSSEWEKDLVKLEIDLLANWMSINFTIQEKGKVFSAKFPECEFIHLPFPFSALSEDALRDQLTVDNLKDLLSAVSIIRSQ